MERESAEERAAELAAEEPTVPMAAAQLFAAATICRHVTEMSARSCEALVGYGRRASARTEVPLDTCAGLLRRHADRLAEAAKALHELARRLSK